MIINESTEEEPQELPNGELLPPGWVVERRLRMSGDSQGKYDPYFIHPDGRRFRSLIGDAGPPPLPPEPA